MMEFTLYQNDFDVIGKLSIKEKAHDLLSWAGTLRCSYPECTLSAFYMQGVLS